MLHYAQQLTVIAMGVFLSSVLFPSSPLTSQYYSIVYAAVISCGPAGSSPCSGTYGDDNMRGDPDRNWMNGLDGNDRMSSEGGNDRMHGGYGDDRLDGGTGDDSLFGSVGADSIKCGPGNDEIWYFTPSEGDTQSNCERFWPSSNATLSGGGLDNDTLRGLGNNTFFTNNSSGQ